jgi:hypothetical protein
MLSQRDIDHVFEQLRKGLVPERGLDAYAVGIEKQRGELHRQLGLAKDGTGNIKFLRGGYGCGKTFMARLASLDAQAQGFATSFVVVSDNDLRFHRFEEVYRKVVTELSTSTCPRGALADILDRWIGRIEAALIATGADDEAPDFDQKVRAKVTEELATLTAGKAPQEFVRVVQTIFELKQEGEVSDATMLISWLSGSGNISTKIKNRAGVKGDIGSRDALAYLRGVLAITKSADYRGIVIVIDEAETILRSRTDSRHKSLNGIRQIADASSEYPGLLWLFTGTPEFFDTKAGVAGLAPLHDRVRFMQQGGFVNVRQPQLELKPFDASRLRNVAVRLRELFPAKDRQRLFERVDDDFIGQLVDKVTEGFRGHVGVVPRQFLREFVNVLDLVEQEETYVPKNAYEFQARELTPEEQAAVGTATPVAAEAEEFVPEEEVW